MTIVRPVAAPNFSRAVCHAVRLDEGPERTHAGQPLRFRRRVGLALRRSGARDSSP